MSLSFEGLHSLAVSHRMDLLNRKGGAQSHLGGLRLFRDSRDVDDGRPFAEMTSGPRNDPDFVKTRSLSLNMSVSEAEHSPSF